MLYFAYGSNMSEKRIQKRCPSAKSMGLYQLKNHRLCFNKAGQDGSGKGNVEPTKDDSQVYGVVFDIDTSEVIDLDHAEALGIAYRKQWLSVFDKNDHSIEVFIYIALQIDNDIKPYPWYKTHLLKGAQEVGLPEKYLTDIENVATIDDLNLKRVALELAIYR